MKESRNNKHLQSSQHFIMLSQCTSIMPFIPPSDTVMSSTNLLKVTQTTNGRPSTYSELPTFSFLHSNSVAAIPPKDCFAFNNGTVFMLLSVILLCLQHSKHSYFSSSNFDLFIRYLIKDKLFKQHSVQWEARFFLGDLANFQKQLHRRGSGVQPCCCSRSLR